MIQKIKKMKIKNILILGAFTLVISILFGQGCGQYSSVQSSSSLNLSSSGVDSIAIIPNTKTVSMTYSRQIVDSMVSCTGVRQSTAAINNVYTNRKGSLSQFGDALEVSAPMLMAVAAVAGEVCNKLLTDEMLVAASQRRIFNRIDFNRAPSSLSSDDIADSVRRLARACWARDESTDELDILLKGINESFGSSDTTKGAMLALCTSMLSSLSGIEN